MKNLSSSRLLLIFWVLAFLSFPVAGNTEWSITIKDDNLPRSGPTRTLPSLRRTKNFTEETSNENRSSFPSRTC